MKPAPTFEERCGRTTAEWVHHQGRLGVRWVGKTTGKHKPLCAYPPTNRKPAKDSQNNQATHKEAGRVTERSSFGIFARLVGGLSLSLSPSNGEDRKENTSIFLYS